MYQTPPNESTNSFEIQQHDTSLNGNNIRRQNIIGELKQTKGSFGREMGLTDEDCDKLKKIALVD